MGDLLSIGLGELQSKFGDNAIWVYELMRGIDRSEVKERPDQTKSMLASKNLPKPITRPGEGQHWIRVLAAELALRLREARAETPGLWPKSIVLHARKGYESSRSRQAPFPFVQDATVDVIAAAGDKLWKELVGVSWTDKTKVSSLQLSFTGIATQETGQQNIEGFFGSRKRKRTEEEDVEKALDDAHDVGFSEFTCERCSKNIKIPWGGKEEEMQAQAIRVEHEDFHFAMDLAKSADMATAAPSKRPDSRSKTTAASSKPQGKGIEKFFKRR